MSNILDAKYLEVTPQNAIFLANTVLTPKSVLDWGQGQTKEDTKIWILTAIINTTLILNIPIHA